ncbi:hypothetical protein K1X80_16585 [Pseudomonas sp. So3.2b]|uniref:hypothetical protein n=1 Tax=Pseudomonas sp. So3.2b TaxID=2864101 RepID=UPI001C693E02|nr:hypothetical protein [Pseudomonas sp. So3.2b]QYM66673.1 hypothetical protein K1X80_16585 [Pseudomonas sp. So3.2b]
MSLTKPNQQLRRDLKEAALAIEDAANSLFKEAKMLEESGFLAAMGQIARLHGHADLLKGYAAEVNSGKIVRTRLE